MMIISEISWINYNNIAIPGFADFLFSHPYGIIIVEENTVSSCWLISVVISHLIVILLEKI